MAKAESPKRRSRGLVWAAALIVAAAGAVAWFGPWTGSGSSRPRVESVTIAAPGPRAIAVSSLQIGGLPTRVIVSSVGIDAPISEVGVVVDNGEAEWETAWHAVGHHIDSALPGQPGNVVLTGHVSVADRHNLAAFARLDSVKEGDVVQVYSGDSVYRYRVDRVAVVPPDAVQVLRSSQASTITLLTCTHDLKNRLVVTGTLT